ncbi:MAG: hypothetical protein ACXWQZ_19560, partial [Ktedonobacterales bacterium]
MERAAASRASGAREGLVLKRRKKLRDEDSLVRSREMKRRSVRAPKCASSASMSFSFATTSCASSACVALRAP